MKKMKLTFVIVCLLPFAAGCASALLAGSRPQKGAPPTPLAVYKATSCTQGPSGPSVAGPADQTYYLVQGEAGLELYELDPKSSGVSITNYWQDENGDNFLTYVKTSSGWHYILPADRKQAGWRHVYLTGTAQVAMVDGVMKIVGGSPTYYCPMMPQ